MHTKLCTNICCVRRFLYLLIDTRATGCINQVRQQSFVRKGLLYLFIVTTQQDALTQYKLFKVFIYIVYIFAATCFGSCWPSSGGIHNYSWKLPQSQNNEDLLQGTVLLITFINPLMQRRIVWTLSIVLCLSKNIILSSPVFTYEIW
jgi:hypothetical protein